MRCYFRSKGKKQNAEGKISIPQGVPILEYFFNVVLPYTNEKPKNLLNIFIYAGMHNNTISKFQENQSEIFQGVFFQNFELVYY